MTVAEDLKFDVMVLLDQLFDVNTAVSESFLGFTTGCIKPLNQTDLIVRRPHPATATTGDRLDHYWKTNLPGDLQGLLLGRYLAVAPRRHRYTNLPRLI